MTRKHFIITVLVAGAVLLLVAPVSMGERPDIYDEHADARADIAKAVEHAKAQNKRVLLQWGGNWCGWCHKLHEVFTKDEAIRTTLEDEYVIVMIDSRTNTELAEDLNSNIRGVPFLTVLDSEGKKLVDQRTGPLEIGDRHDPTKVLAFLEKWKAPRATVARAVLNETVARAKAEDKLAFVHFSTPTCGWCKRLEAFLKRPAVADVFSKHFVAAKIDQVEMADGTELRREIAASRKSGGVPWHAILDGDGKVLATATGPNGNIGYPVKDSEIMHFISMLRKSSRQITADELGIIERELRIVAAELGR